MIASTVAVGRRRVKAEQYERPGKGATRPSRVDVGPNATCGALRVPDQRWGERQRSGHRRVDEAGVDDGHGDAARSQEYAQPLGIGRAPAFDPQ